ncbi:TIGR02757 family protein [bacterium]|nr:TIGR02757 family protein [bacterium]
MANEFKTYLDQLYATFDHSFIHSDPIQLVKRFDDPLDQEIVALIVTSLAFGQVQQIVKAGELVLDLMHQQPRRFVDTMDPEVEIKKWRKFYYRMIKHTDLLRLLYALKMILKRFDTIGNWVYSHYQKEDEHLGVTWAKCVEEIKKTDLDNWTWKRSKGIGFNHLLPNPTNKSACKRANLLLRWMVRIDQIDLGLWDKLPANKLIIPVDTHIQRIAYNIGLTNRTDLSWKTAIEITKNLRQLDPNDPVKYDFALCRLGILNMCPKKRDINKCNSCPIFDICRL